MSATCGAGLGAVDWLNGWDLTKAQPIPLASQGPSMLMYTMECYSAGWPYIVKDPAQNQTGKTKVAWCFHWISEQQAKPLVDTPWPVTKGWGMKFGGLPFHRIPFPAPTRPRTNHWSQMATRRCARLEAALFGGKQDLTQLPMYMLMSYAERLEPGGIYREDAPKTSP